jgi:beta-glucanase (GH16 family)
MEESVIASSIFTKNKNRMNKIKIFLVNLIWITALFSCSTAVKNNDFQTIKTSSGEWELIWNEEFNYEGLPDSTKWSFDVDGNDSGWGNNEKQYYTKADKRNAWVQDGFLTITALKDSMEGKPYTSARLRTKGKGDWLYGRFEIRAKNPTGLGTWPAIWMLPTDWAYGGWPASGEIDIMENVGYDPDTIVGSAHTQKYNHLIGTQKSAKIYFPTNYTDYHVYALEWETDEYRLFIDDEHYYTFKKEGADFESWPFDKPFHLLLNLAIGGNWGGKMGIDDSLFPHKFSVDYVRVYQRK